MRNQSIYNPKKSLAMHAAEDTYTAACTAIFDNIAIGLIQNQKPEELMAKARLGLTNAQQVLDMAQRLIEEFPEA